MPIATVVARLIGSAVIVLAFAAILWAILWTVGIPITLKGDK